MKYVFWAILAAFLLGTSISVVSVWQTVESERLVFCLSQECIKLAKSKFDGALWLFKLVTDFCVAAATVAAGYYALRTYMDSVYARRSSQVFEHYKNFCSLIDLAPIDYRWNFSVSSKKKLYRLLFPSASSANFQVSQKYIDFLRSLCADLDSASDGYGVGGFDKQRHSDMMVNRFGVLEIFFPDYRLSDYYSFEVRACGFIDYLSSNYPGVSIVLSRDRHYKVAW